MKKNVSFVFTLLLFMAICTNLTSPAWAIKVTNTTTGVVLFEDGFEENTLVCYSPTGVDLEDYDPVAPTGYGPYDFSTEATKSVPYATQVCNTIADEARGLSAFEGNNYLRVERPGSYYAGIVNFAAQSTVGDVLHIESMVSRYHTSGPSTSSYLSFLGNDNLPTTHYYSRETGAVCDKSGVDTRILNMTNECEWYKLEVDYAVGSDVFSLSVNGRTVDNLPIYPDSVPSSITGFRISPTSYSNQTAYFDKCVEGWEAPFDGFVGNETLVNGDFSDGLNGWMTFDDSSNGTPVDMAVANGVATISRENGCSDWSTGFIYQVVNVPEGTKVRVDGQWAGDQTGLAPEDMWWGEVAVFSIPDLTTDYLADIADYPGYLQYFIEEGATNRGGSYATASEMLNSFGDAYPSWAMEDIDNSLYDWEATKAAFEANEHTWDPEQRLEYNFTEVESCGQVVVALKYGGQSPAGSMSFDNITLTVVPDNVAGDANGDGKVDGSDVTILAGNWQKGVSDGLTATWAEGDFNGDGKVDGSDVTILAGNWQYGVEAAAAAVPEPSTIILILCGIGAMFAFRRR